ncbi:hypothetical protein AVEN_135481-1 [Araneus ventricosus]|uniref:Uncharacterized protein n=1 Tax=Araneus ventricosus TaxID=182803 RepID=A0A4Y2BF28_ARAVE|nr:hypothetical protein AVEN_135481-1 [Araneus ventricosus]
MTKLDLNAILEEICSWKTLLKKKDEEIDTLQQQLNNILKQNKLLKDTHASHLHEISQLNSAVSSLHITISRLQNSEVERKTLLCEKQNLKNCLDEKEKAQQIEIEELKKELEQIKSAHREDMKRELKHAEFKAQATLESFMNKIREKENQILVLQDEITKLKSEKNQGIFKIQMECEEKVNKLKSRLSKHRGINSLQDGLKKDDIFRQKYIKIEKDSKEEISKLNNEIKDLKSQIEALKHSNVHINSLNGGTECENERQSIFTKDLNHHSKRLKIDESHETEFSFGINKINANNSNLVKPIKKKLFNLDSNYFGK